MLVDDSVDPTKGRHKSSVSSGAPKKERKVQALTRVVKRRLKKVSQSVSPDGISPGSLPQTGASLHNLCERIFNLTYSLDTSMLTNSCCTVLDN